METAALVEQGLDNNQPNQEVQLFNGDGVAEKQKDDVMFNFADNYTQNGTDISPTKDMDFYEKEKSNGKRQFDEDDDDEDDDFGPETDVDAVDEPHISPFKSDLAGKGCDSKMFEEVDYHQDNRIYCSETQDNRMFGGGDPLGGYNKMFGGEEHPQMFGGGDKMFGDEEEHEMIKGDEGVCNPFMEHMEKAEKEDGGMKENNKNEEEEEQQRVAREETPTPPADAVHDVSGLVDNAADSDSEDEWNYIKGEEADKENTPPRAHKRVDDIPEGGEVEGVVAASAVALDAPARSAAEAEAEAMSQLNPNAAEFVPVSPATSPTGGPAARLLEDEIIAQSPKRPMNLDRVVDAKQFEQEVKSRPSELDDSFCSNGHAENEHNLSSEMMENLLNGKNIDEIPEFQPGSTPTKTRPDEFHFGPNAAPFTPKHLDQSEALSTKAVFGDDTAQNLDLSLNTTAERTSPVKSPIKKESDDPMSMSFYAERDDANPFDLNKVQMLPDNLDEFLQQPDNNATTNLPAEQKSDNLIMNNDDALQTTDLDKHSYDDEKELASPLEPEKELSCHDFREDGITPEPTNENLLGGDFCQFSQKSKTPDTLPRDVELISPDSANESKSPTEESRPESIPPDVELLSPQPKPEQLQQTATEVDDLLGGFGSHQQEELLCERPASCERPVSSERPTSESPLCERPESKSPMMCERPTSESPAACERPESKSPAFEQVAMEQNAFGDNPFMAETNKEEVKTFEPEEPMQKQEEPEASLDEDDVKATIVVGPEGVIEIEEEPSEYIPSPAAEPVDLEPQVIEPVQDLCPLEKPVENTEVFECGDVEVNKEAIMEKPVGEVEVRTENISPQFAEQAFVMTPSEESKQEEAPAAPLPEEPVKEPLPIEPPAADHAAAEVAAVAAGVAAAATAAVAAATAVSAPTLKPAEDKKKPGAATTPAAKKPSATPKTNATPSPRPGAAKPGAAGSAAAKKTAPAAPKASPTKTAAAQKSPAVAAAAKPAATKPAVPKPRTIPPAKPADKKPLANGDVKQPPIRSTLTAKKSVTETAASKTTARPATTAARPATAAPRTTTSAPKPAPRPATAPKAAAPRTNGTTTATASRLKPTTAAAAPKSPVASKTTSTTTKTATSLTSKTTTSATSRPAFTTNTKPNKPVSSVTNAPAPPKPRVPISRRPATETDKQSKEAVNKATAGKTTATRTGVTALRKVESKAATTTRTTVMKSTTTTMKSTTAAKKPAEIIRNKSSKPTTNAKPDKPELNGVASEAPEAVKAPANDVLLTDSDTQLVKDNSPAIDNKTIENTLIQNNAAD